MLLAPTTLISSGGSSSNEDTAQLTTPLLFESACPAPLLSRLQCTFSPSSPFWSEHGYFEEGSPYFSYLYDLVRVEGCPCIGMGRSWTGLFTPWLGHTFRTVQPSWMGT